MGENIKISIAYPPIESKKGFASVSQNRQSQFFHEPQPLQPIVMSWAATMLSKKGYEVYWNDGISEEKSEKKFLEQVVGENPDYVVIEGKTPVMGNFWTFTDKIKELLPETRVVFVGDHVTALPMETFEKSKTDYVVTGGDYDFLLLNLIEHDSRGVPLEPGIWHKGDGEIKSTGEFQLNHDLDNLPLINRELTNWRLYAYKCSLYKTGPGFYIMAGRDCWWHKCTFCSWTTLYPEYRTRSHEKVVDEIGFLIEEYGAKDIFDDTGSFPTGDWLRRFCRLMIDRGYNKKVRMGCNMRAGSATHDDFVLMKNAGFRTVLIGLESANQETLDRINKGLRIEEMVDTYKAMSKAGLEVHITVMFGYPWETLGDAKRTLELSKYLLRKGIASTVQATNVVPYPGTPLFEYCKRNGLLKTFDWEDYDMSKLVMKAPISDKDVAKMAQDLYKMAFHPELLARKTLKIRSLDDVKFYFKLGKEAFGRIKDFRENDDLNLN